MPFEKRWISVREASEYLSFKSAKSLYDMINRGLIPIARIGRAIRVDMKRLKENLEAQSQPKGAALRERR